MAAFDIESVIKNGVERALNEPIMNGKSVMQWAEIGMHSQERSQWIRVENKLPKDYEYVLAAFVNGDMVVACVFERDEDMVYWRAQTDRGWECDMDFSPTYWMPLPEPPKEESDD